MTELIQVLVVDDHVVVREGLSALLIPRNGMEVVGEAVDGADAVEKARILNPDVILMDLNLPVMSGLEAITEIIRENPEARILVLTSFDDESNISAAIEAGALGYLSKNSSTHEMFHAIQGVAMGSLSVSPGVTRTILQHLRKPDPPFKSNVAALTERELDVLRALGQGLSNQEIAEKLNIEVTTVRSHISRILNKLGLDNRTQVALYAVETGLVQPKE
jgi:DNA-binding NarL/FixJ family response regulator